MLIYQKYGRPNEATPAKWNAEYKDFTAPLENGTTQPPKRIEAPVSAVEDQAQAGSTVEAPKPSEASPPNGEGTSKKRKKHDEDETAEERAERKRKKKEKKEQRKTKKVDSDEASD